MTAPADPSRCPLCGQRNACGMQAGSGECWCFNAQIPRDVLGRVPEEARGVACICRDCARKQPGAAEDLAELLRRRDSPAKG